MNNITIKLSDDLLENIFSIINKIVKEFDTN